jgi:hypothetical protein
MIAGVPFFNLRYSISPAQRHIKKLADQKNYSPKYST